ncbi:MAG: beta-lactamase family protein [Clostridiales bacterium]|nr:beta-lactamase family protein [Clostridiales bacterium]
MKKLISISIILSIALSLVACKPKKATLESRINVEAEIAQLQNVERNIWINENTIYESIVKYLLYTAQETNLRGSLIVATDDEVLFVSGTRLSDINGDEVTPYTTYEIGSLTKSFVAVCILKLIEEGKLSMDNTLADFYPEYSSCPNYGKTSKVTIFQMLHMRSGIPDYLNQPERFFDEKEVMDILGPDEPNMTVQERLETVFETVDEEKYLTRLFTCEPNSEPDTAYEYSNTNYRTLAMIIEKVSGKKYEEYVNEVIFTPCKMTGTSSMAVGDITASVGDSFAFLPMYTFGAGDIHSNVVDMLKYNRALFGGYLLNKQSMAKIFEMVDMYACGWSVGGLNGYGKHIGEDVTHHTGATEAFHSADYVIERNGKHLYIIMLAPNGANPVDKTLYPMLDNLFEKDK